MENTPTVPMLFPLAPDVFFTELRRIIQEEMTRNSQKEEANRLSLVQMPGLRQKPLYKLREVCLLFGVSRPTIYVWIRLGKLHPVKIRSRVYFLGGDIEALLNPALQDDPSRTRN